MHVPSEKKKNAENENHFYNTKENNREIPEFSTIFCAGTLEKSKD